MKLTYFQRVKKGLIEPKDVMVNQTLQPTEAESFIQSMMDQTQFLGKISVTKLNKLKGNVNILDIAPRQMARVAEGSEPTASQLAGIENIGKQFDCLPVQLFFTLPYSTISNNADDPEFEQKVDEKFAMSVGNNILDLAWNGNASTGGSFLALNKGWLQIAIDNKADTRPTHEVIVEEGATLSVACEKLAEALPSKYKATASYIMSKYTQERLILELGREIGSTIVIAGELKQYLGYPVEISEYLADNTIILTPLANLAFGINRALQMSRDAHGRKRAVEYTFDMNMDFEIAINDAFAWVVVE